MKEAFSVLEFDRILELAGENTLSEVGFEFLSALADESEWAKSIETATKLQQETFEILHLVDRDQLWSSLRDLASPVEILEALEKGAVLNLENLTILRGWLYSIDAWAEFPLDAINAENLKKAIQAMPSVRDPIREMNRVITTTGEINEKATPRLARVSQEILEIKKQISLRMERVLKEYSEKGVLQENYSDVHDGRYVLPVKTNQQNQIEGMIYGSSSSRQTVFIEPAEVAQMNNQLRVKEHEREDEIYAILEKLCASIRPYSEEITHAVQVLGYWDHVRAKAIMAGVYAGKKIQLNREGKISLRQTAHPLLWWSMPAEDIIKNDIDLSSPTRTILLTGPNTGGKTVFLKTLGLAGIFAKCGFLFPGSEAQTVPLFSTIFVDLGDPQSIEQHLSSFSGHISRFKSILQEVDRDSLVLLDELNSATDPSEGAALGRAFLETVMNRGAITVATTHDPQLKAAATEDRRILNASMAFDENARTPTFTLKFGVIGRSRALETAERLGLPREVLDLAKKFLSDEHLRLESVLTRLEKDSDIARDLRRDAQRLKDEAERLKNEWQEQQKKNFSEIFEKMRSKMRGVLEQAQDEIRAHVRALSETKTHKALDERRGNLNESFKASLERLENVLQEEAPELARDLELSKEKTVEQASAFKTGDVVRVPKWKSLGKILAIDGEKIKIQLGLVQVSLSRKEIESTTSSEQGIYQQQKKSESRRTEQAIQLQSITDSVPDQIDLRGKRHDEAMSELESYLDQAFRSHRAQVTIVHGLGTGALRESTRKLLKSLPYVKSASDGGLGSGGSGATKVEFDR
jgi:DNA mismatch repair protein MutS2